MSRITEVVKGFIIALIILTALVVVGRRAVSSVSGVSIGDVFHDEEMSLRRDFQVVDTILNTIER